MRSEIKNHYVEDDEHNIHVRHWPDTGHVTLEINRRDGTASLTAGFSGTTALEVADALYGGTPPVSST